MFQNTAQAKQAHDRAQGILWNAETLTEDDIRKAYDIIRKAESYLQRSGRTKRR
jgi:hypothetical protein